MPSNGGGRYSSERRTCDVCHRRISKARYLKHKRSKAHSARAQKAGTAIPPPAPDYRDDGGTPPSGAFRRTDREQG